MLNESFWDYSCRVYRAEGVSEACLHLQDAYGLDVNLLLLCCWHASTRGAIAQTQFAQILSTSKSWADNVVAPLRAARRWMKNQLALEALPSTVLSKQFVQLREQIKNLELQCEQHQQSFLQDLSASTPQRMNESQQLKAAAGNIQMLLCLHSCRDDAALKKHCSELICAVVAHPSISASAAQEITLQALS